MRRTALTFNDLWEEEILKIRGIGGVPAAAHAREEEQRLRKICVLMAVPGVLDGAFGDAKDDPYRMAMSEVSRLSSPMRKARSRRTVGCLS